MLKIDESKTEIRGSKLNIQAEFATLLTTLLEKKIMTKKELKYLLKVVDEELEYSKKEKEKNGEEQ